MTNKSIREYINLIENAQYEGKKDLHARLHAINQKLKLMKGVHPATEPSISAFHKERHELAKEKENILSQLKQGVAEGSNNDYQQGVDDGVEYFLYTDGEGDTIKDVFLQMKRSATEPKSEEYWRGVVDGMKSVQGEEQLEETTPDAMAKIDDLFRK